MCINYTNLKKFDESLGYLNRENNILEKLEKEGNHLDFWKKHIDFSPIVGDPLSISVSSKGGWVSSVAFVLWAARASLSWPCVLWVGPPLFMVRLFVVGRASSVRGWAEFLWVGRLLVWPFSSSRALLVWSPRGGALLVSMWCTCL
jgi:hypothetical protein